MDVQKFCWNWFTQCGDPNAYMSYRKAGKKEGRPPAPSGNAAPQLYDDV